MLKHVVLGLCKQPQLAVVYKQLACKSSTYFCFNTALPVVPACFWSKLPNGVRLVTEQTCGPLACVAIFAEAGPRYEAKCNHGITHMFEHMAYKAYDNCFREIGARATVHTDREYQMFSVTCPSSEVNCVINLFFRMFTELAFNSYEFDSEKDNIIREITEEEKEPCTLMFDYLNQTAFQGTPLGQSVIGPVENYEQFDCNFLKEYVCQHYQPFRLVLSVSSTFSHCDVKAMAQCSLGQLVQTQNDLESWPCRYSGSELRYRDDDMPYAHVALAVETCGYSSKDYLTMHLLKHIIGRWDASQCQGKGTWPLLAYASETSKLCVHYEAFYIPYRDVGLFGVYVVVPKDTEMDDTMIMVQDDWMKLCHMTQWTDVERGAASLRRELAKKAEGCVNSCHEMGIQMLYYGSRQNLVQLYDEVSMIKQLEVREAATRILYDRCPALSAIGPVESVPHYTRIRSGMYWLRL